MRAAAERRLYIYYSITQLISKKTYSSVFLNIIALFSFFSSKFQKIARFKRHLALEMDTAYLHPSMSVAILLKRKQHFLTKHKVPGEEKNIAVVS